MRNCAAVLEIRPRRGSAGRGDLCGERACGLAVAVTDDLTGRFSAVDLVRGVERRWGGK